MKIPLRGGRLPAPGLTAAPQQRAVLQGGFAYEPWGQHELRPRAMSWPRIAFERVRLLPFSDWAGLQWVNCSRGTAFGDGRRDKPNTWQIEGWRGSPFIW